MRHLIAALSCAIALAGPAGAQQSGTVVELYTSQGCSSCPPADRLLAQMADRDDVIAIALHVDYWDYIGWTDDLARPEYTQRQRAYAQRWNAKNVYTPQMVIAGAVGVVGSDPGAVMNAMAVHRNTASPIALEVLRRGDGLHISARAIGDVPAQALVQVVSLTHSVTRNIERGENAGKTIDYRNVVTGWQNAGIWTTAQPARLSVPLDHAGPVVVIVQDGTSGPILGAVKLP
ncbi:DUF1223 domain-containing protein [Loktanella sp. TSTF-M6]|uniref:DUF1223 domain-containing protein n=1 Tax=Loktanella gaetbuli TaxID=2881335 RepID=A0ABS8BQV2_9RHOB|nr:DUF1223 domain-containing protein [Loktanella gaetbuli]MCB5197911.1 DUF1223 domain-containing protein [Loktanella gaetbuli]